MKEFLTEGSKRTSLKDRARNIAETAVGLITAPLFFATVIRFPVRYSVVNFNPRARDSFLPAIIDETGCEIRIPTGTSITGIVDGINIFVADKKERPGRRRAYRHTRAIIGGIFVPKDRTELFMNGGYVNHVRDCSKTLYLRRNSSPIEVTHTSEEY